MADVTVNVIEPATNFDFLTLDEAKILLGITPSDTSQDAQLAMLISINSANVAEMCNRTFAREKVRETWRELFDGRVFLTRSPVKLEDIERVSGAGAGYAKAGNNHHPCPAEAAVLATPLTSDWKR